MLTTMQGLEEDAMYVSQGEIPIYGGDDVYQWSCDCFLSLPQVFINQWEPQLTHSEASLQIY